MLLAQLVENLERKAKSNISPSSQSSSMLMINIFEILTVKNKVMWGLVAHDMSKMKEQSWSGIQSFSWEKGGAAGGRQGALQHALAARRQDVCRLAACSPFPAIILQAPLNSCARVETLRNPYGRVCWHLLFRGTRSSNHACVPVPKQTLPTQ